MDRETASKMLPIIKAYAEGHDIRVLGIHAEDPDFNGPSDDYEIVPKLQPVDLSVLIESGIDCEFSNDNMFDNVFTSKLRRIEEDGYCDGNDNYDYCRPRKSHIHYWPGGECPLPPGLSVNLHLRGGATFTMQDGCVYRWDYRKDYGAFPNQNDVIAFEVLGLADGWAWPGECE